MKPHRRQVQAMGSFCELCAESVRIPRLAGTVKDERIIRSPNPQQVETVLLLPTMQAQPIDGERRQRNRTARAGRFGFLEAAVMEFAKARGQAKIST